jgi:hypothetical protein
MLWLNLKQESFGRLLLPTLTEKRPCGGPRKRPTEEVEEQIEVEEPENNSNESNLELESVKHRFAVNWPRSPKLYVTILIVET